MLEEAIECRDAVRRGSAAASGVAGMNAATCASTCSTSPTNASPASACRSGTAARNPFGFMELQDVQELTNFFERRVSAYQVGRRGHGRLDDVF